MANKVRFVDNVGVSAFGASAGTDALTNASASANNITFTKGDNSQFTITVDTGSGGGGGITDTGSLMTTASVSNNTITFTKGDGSTFPITVDTGSGGSGSNITYNSSGSQVIQNIIVRDFDTDVTVTFDAGNLTFLFGAPQAPSPSLSISGFNTNRFNKVTDNYTVTGIFNIEGYDLISASIFETTAGSEGVVAGPTGTGDSLSFSPTTTGSRSYRLEITSSNPADSSIDTRSATDSETLSKTQPAIPTVSATATVQLGATSNQIEEGATGSISFTATTGSANDWVYIGGTLSTNYSSPISITNSDVGGYSISASANYSSSGVGGSDNDPVLTVTKTSSTTTFSRIRSLRFGASTDANYDITELRDIDAWDTTLGGNVGTISKGTTNPVGQTVAITWTSDKYHYIIYDSSRSDLNDIKETTTQFSVLNSSFGGGVYATVGNYKIYRTSDLQAGYSGTTTSYDLS